jgi:hypothetical protein
MVASAMTATFPDGAGMETAESMAITTIAAQATLPIQTTGN